MPLPFGSLFLKYDYTWYQFFLNEILWFNKTFEIFLFKSIAYIKYILNKKTYLKICLNWQKNELLHYRNSLAIRSEQKYLTLYHAHGLI